MALTLLVGRQALHPPYEMLGVGMLVVVISLELCTSYGSSKIAATTSIIPGSSKMHNRHRYRLTKLVLENSR